MTHPLRDARILQGTGSPPQGRGSPWQDLAWPCLSAGLEPVFHEHPVDGRIADEGVLFFGLLLGGQKFLIMVDTDGLPLDLEHDLLPCHMVGYQVSVPVVGELTLLIDGPEEFE